MTNARTRRLLAMSGLVWGVVGTGLQAQTAGGWNRRVDAIAILPTPQATGDSFFDIWVDVSIEGDDVTPVPTVLNMGTEVMIHVNGSLVQSHTIAVPLDPMAGGDCLDCQSFDCGDLSCGSAGNGSADMKCVKDDFCFGPGSVLDCKCVLPKPCLADPSCVPDLPLASNIPLQPGDEIMVLLRPSPGAMPDGDTGDDLMAVIHGDPSGWTREIRDVVVTPSPLGPGLFDVEVQWSAGSFGIGYPVDLSAEIEVRVGGVPAAQAVDEWLHSPIPCQQALAPPVGNCSQGTCGSATNGAGGFAAMSCTVGCLNDNEYPCWCLCEADHVLLLPAVPLPPGESIEVILRPVPGALPELPPFDPEEEEHEVPRRCGDVADCCDLDSNTVRDNNCAWCGCENDACLLIPLTTFADMGGAFGSCPPDTFANVHDKNHALSCFAGNNTCDSLNIDAGGPFGACPPDGFCNIHDANHAMAAFAGTSSCSCPAAVMPEFPPVVVDEVNVELRPARRTVAPGDHIAVEVWVRGGIDNLQSYQLDVTAGGGQRGHLTLVDIELADSPDAVFADEASFSAVNVQTGQMLQGLEHSGTAVRDDAYLATFIYAVSRDARGVFVVDLLHEPGSGGQTYFVSDFVDAIAVADIRPAVITVAPSPRARKSR